MFGALGQLALGEDDDEGILVVYLPVSRITAPGVFVAPKQIPTLENGINFDNGMIILWDDGTPIAWDS